MPLVSSVVLARFVRKFAGKTTLALTAISHNAGHFMANDRVFLFDDGGICARALPIAASIRPKTIVMCERLVLLIGIAASLHPENRDPTSLDSDEVEARVLVPPHELVKLLQCEIVARAPVVCVVFPCFDPGISNAHLKRLSEGKALDMLEQSDEGFAFLHEDYEESWLHMPLGDLVAQHHSFLVRALQRVPAYALHQSEDTLHQAGEILGTLATGGACASE